MSYSEFSLKTVKKDFGILEIKTPLFSELVPIEQSPWLRETLAQTLDVALISEKSRSEGIVLPILVEMRTRNNNCFAIYSGANLEADKERGLNGECDFILTKSPQTFGIEAPIFCLVEAKDNDIELGLAQCIAQMQGAKIFNENDGNPIQTIFGCVTTGEDWQFLKLENNTVFIDSTRYYLNKIEEILGVFQTIIDLIDFQ